MSLAVYHPQSSEAQRELEMPKKSYALRNRRGYMDSTFNDGLMIVLQWLELRRQDIELLLQKELYMLRRCRGCVYAAAVFFCFGAAAAIAALPAALLRSSASAFRRFGASSLRPCVFVLRFGVPALRHFDAWTLCRSDASTL